jgi:phage shock protein A
MNMSFPQYDEERLAQLLKMLPPAPEGWVKAAQELPRARQEIDEIATRADMDAEFRAAVNADLEAALEQAGYDVDPSLLPELRDRLSGS